MPTEPTPLPGNDVSCVTDEPSAANTRRWLAEVSLIDCTSQRPSGLKFPSQDRSSLATNAAGQSTASGAGNLITQFATNAGAHGQIQYNYLPDEEMPVPEPVSLVLVGTGLAGLVRRRLKQRS